MDSILTPSTGNSLLTRLQHINERVVLFFGIGAFLVVLALSVASRVYLESYQSLANSKLAAPTQRTLVKGDVLIPVTLSLKVVDGRAILRGMLPSEAAHQTVLARAREIYGQAKVEDKLGIQSGIVVTPWFDSVLKWFPPRVDELRTGEISVSGMNVLIFGRVATDESRLAAGRTLAKLVGPEGKFSNELQVGYVDDTPVPAATPLKNSSVPTKTLDDHLKTSSLRTKF
jgi:hypothetical protein